ncbi:hypothetical protein GCM10009639_34070 [Kitasatospora putterlickiae]|uniref:HTH gntR-type domain-containing protein n=1 Tax=Kitasatospora putterlickiae TaxID=221725 RepID=A0ABN1Y3Q4_9ACTN
MPERSPRGTYLRIADTIETEIRRNSTVTLLPSEAQLMEAHGVGRTTVRRALDSLATRGLITSRPGSGWVVVGAERKPPVLDQLTTLVRTLDVGADFPSEKELTEITGAARGTVRRALAQLEGAGVLEVRHGKGRRVRALPDNQS